MELLQKEYGISVEYALIEAKYTEQALSELVGHAGKLIVQKAIELN